MKKTLYLIGIVFICLSSFGGCSSFLNSVGVGIGDGDTYNGVVHEVNRNPDFFKSENKVINTILILPGWFNKVYYDHGYNNDSYGFVNQTCGLLCLLLLIYCVVIKIDNEKHTESLDIYRILAWIYIIYWSMPTIWMIYQWGRGMSLTTQSTWS
jgi:Mn2+/Fe2+ NRAMP family transporter